MPHKFSCDDNSTRENTGFIDRTLSQRSARIGLVGVCFTTAERETRPCRTRYRSLLDGRNLVEIVRPSPRDSLDFRRAGKQGPRRGIVDSSAIAKIRRDNWAVKTAFAGKWSIATDFEIRIAYFSAAVQAKVVDGDAGSRSAALAERGRAKSTCCILLLSM